MNSSIIEPFVGIWKRDIFGVICYYIIKNNGSDIAVSAYDSSDNEEFKISNIILENSELSFETLMPSTGWKVKHLVTLINNSEAKVITSFQTVDRWLKINTCKGSNPLEGIWSGEENDAYDSRCLYQITVKNSHPSVKVHDTIDGEKLVVSNISWDANGGIKFDTLLKSSHRSGKHVARSINNNEMELTSSFTHIFYWQKES